MKKPRALHHFLHRISDFELRISDLLNSSCSPAEKELPFSDEQRFSVMLGTICGAAIGFAMGYEVVSRFGTNVAFLIVLPLSHCQTFEAKLPGHAEKPAPRLNSTGSIPDLHAAYILFPST